MRVLAENIIIIVFEGTKKEADDDLFTTSQYFNKYRGIFLSACKYAKGKVVNMSPGK